MRVCVIGAGPSGISTLIHWAKLKEEGDDVPEVVCYEKQEVVGGQWNFSWRIGSDQNGEECHSSVYRHMRANTPKEVMEYPDFTFDQHFSTPTPSYLTTELMTDYLQGRVANCPIDLNQHIHFNTVVKHVAYDDVADSFSVTVRDYNTDTETTSAFSHVIVATGIFHTPRYPSIPGLETFHGRVVHSHNFRNGKEFAGQRVLLIGALVSAHDIALHLAKYGAAHVVINYRKQPTGFIFPSTVEERTALERIANKTAYFGDGSTFEADAIILCTGYLCNFPFLSDNLRYDLQSPPPLYPDLYKGTLWLNGGNNKLFYLGLWLQIYSFPIFEAQARWAWKFLLGDIPKPGKEEMLADLESWKKRAWQLFSVESLKQVVEFQSAVMDDLSIPSGHKSIHKEMDEIMFEFCSEMKKHLPSYKDKVYRSVLTGTQALKPQIPWMEDSEDEFEVIVNRIRKLKRT